MIIRQRSTTWHEIFAYGVVLIVSLYFLMPWQPRIGEGLDYAWAMILNLVYEQQLQFGVDVLFTYGSWGFVEQGQYYPATRRLVLVLSAFIIALWTSSIWLAVGPWIARSRWWRVTIFILLVVVSLLMNPWFTLVFATGFLIALAPCRFRLSRLISPRASYVWRHRWSLAVGWTGLMVFAGVASHMKLTYNVVMLGCIGAMTLTLLFQPRPSSMTGRKNGLAVVWLLSVYVLSWIAAWVGIGQSLAHVVAYFRGARQIISTYGDAMAFPGAWWQGIELFVVVMAVFAVVVRMIYVRSVAKTNHHKLYNRLVLVFRIAAAAGLLFIVFKSAIVRQGNGHFTLVVGVLAGICLLSTASLANKYAQRLRGHPRGRAKLPQVIVSGVLIALAVAGCMTMSMIHHLGPVRYVSSALQVSRWDAMVTFLRYGDAHIKPLWQQKYDEVGQKFPWGSSHLTTDIYPTRLDIGVWSGYPLSLRPSMQSYVAANDTLLRMNSEHLLGNEAPQQIVLMHGGLLDGQYPAFSDSLSWPLLLTHYDIQRIVGSDVILRRNSQPRQMRLVALSSQTIQMGKGAWVPQPPDGTQGIWATIRLKPSMWGTLRGVFYKRPVMVMEYILMDNSKQQARFMPLVSSAGFLLSPKVDFGPQWLAFATNDPQEASIPQRQAKAVLQQNTIKAIKIRPFSGVLDWPSYEEKIEVTYWGFAFEPQRMPAENSMLKQQPDAIK